MNKEWTSLSSRIATVLLSYTHRVFTHMRHNTATDTRTSVHLCHSHTCQSCFSLTERRKGEWETWHFAGLELLASVGLVGLSIHVQRKRLSDSLLDGWWAWVLRTQGFWHCVHLDCVCIFLCTNYISVLVCLCVYCLFWVCGAAELWAFWGFQSSSTLLCNSSPLLFRSGEDSYQSSRAMKPPLIKLPAIYAQKTSNTNFTVAAMNKKFKKGIRVENYQIKDVIWLRTIHPCFIFAQS